VAAPLTAAILQIYCRVYLQKNFHNWSAFGIVMGKKVHCLKRPVHCRTVQLKDKLVRDPMWPTGTVVTASHWNNGPQWPCPRDR